MKCLLPLVLTVLLAVMVKRVYGVKSTEELSSEAEPKFRLKCGVDEEYELQQREDNEEMEPAMLAMNQPPEDARSTFPEMEASNEAGEPLPTPKIVI